jgi:Fe-S cluster biogenesis protein NfuA
MSMLLNSLTRRLPKSTLFAASPFQQTLRSLFIQSSDTPNPNSIKYTPGRIVYDSNFPGHKASLEKISEPSGDESDEQTSSRGFHVTASDPTSVRQSPLGKRLLAVHPSVTSVYLTREFLTVTKDFLTPWDVLNPMILGGIMDHYSEEGIAVIGGEEDDVVAVNPDDITDDDDEITEMIKELLTTRIRPSVQADGGDIRFHNWDEPTGMVEVRLEGSCVGCPSSEVTLKNGVENMMMHYIPEVKGVVNVGDGTPDNKKALHHDNEDSGNDDEYQNHFSDTDGEEWLNDIQKAANMVEKTQKNKKSYEDKLRDAGIPYSD